MWTLNGELRAPTSTDRASRDSTTPVPTITEHTAVEHTAVEHVTAREIAEFLHDLAELRRGASDPSERAVFLARKSELFGGSSPT